MEFETCKNCKKGRLKKLIDEDGICRVCRGELDLYKKKTKKPDKKVIKQPLPKKSKSAEEPPIITEMRRRIDGLDVGHKVVKRYVRNIVTMPEKEAVVDAYFSKP